MEFSACIGDDSLGPVVQGCRDNFDFTLRFESIVLSIVPNSIFVAIAILRTAFLCRQKRLVLRGALLLAAKLTVASAYLCLQISLVALSAKHRILQPFISSTIVSTLFAACIVPLSFLEHSRSARPSVALSICLGINLLLGIAQTRTLWLVTADSQTHNAIFARLFTAAVVADALLLLLENQGKSRWIRCGDGGMPPPEEVSGIFSLGTFFWMRQLFLDGYRKVLRVEDLFPLDRSLSVETIQPKMERILSPGLGAHQSSLVLGLAKILSGSLMIPIIPRLCLVGFRFSQPMFIEALLGYLQQPEAPSNKGYGLIGAAVLIYSGIAVSNALYWYFHERMLCKNRAVLVTAVYEAVTRAPASASNSDALTLMSTDIEQIAMGFLNLHEFWANSIEIGLAVWMLERHLGLASLAPIATVLVCAICSLAVLRLAGSAQETWMAKTQERVGFTASVISGMKQFKISSLTRPVEHMIQKMRVSELEAASSMRLIIIVVATLGYAPMAISPVITFALTSRTLEVSTVYTSMSYLVLLGDPLGNLFEAVPSLLAGLACLRRIQTFLRQEARTDLRTPRADVDGEEAVVSIRDGSFGWENGKYILANISVNFLPCRLAMVVGPVASGKSTLCKAILGEVPVSSGKVITSSTWMSKRIGYCDQTPYLANQSIRDNIIGFSPFDPARYEEVVFATLLQSDFDQLSRGDDTLVGSSGIAVSGGQRQRISIARALYLDTNFLVFDDVLSGLDEHTAEQVFHRVFGPDGLLRRRKSTAILCTHAIRWLPAADQIIVINSSGGITEQRGHQDLGTIEKNVRGLGIDPHERPNVDIEKVLESTTTALATQPSQSHRDDQVKTKASRGVYRRYISTLGKRNIFAFLIFGAGWGFFYNWGNIWLKFWSEDSSSNPSRTKSFYVGMYGLFQMLYLASLFFAAFICFRHMIQTSGARLHHTALHTLVTAQLGLFASTDHGVITNLFSQDLTLIDGELPMAVVNLSWDIFNALGMAAVIATSSPYLALAYPVIAAVLYVVQKFYLRTSRQLRILDLEAKSPLYTQFLDTLKGVVTLRAFGWVQDNIGLNGDLLDTSQRPAYLLAMAQRCLGFTVQTLTAVLAVIVVSLATQLRSNSAFTGASLVTLMSFGDILAFIVRWYTQVETCIGAVSRLKIFSESTPVEGIEESAELDGHWPSRGEIEMQGVSATYSDNEASSTSSISTPLAMVLNNITFKILPGQKVAICGRTGSGKSSLLLLLLRLLDPVAEHAQHIIVDGVPIARVPPATLRQRIIAIPQDPIFFPSGTSFAFNLDPLQVSTESECREVLGMVGLLDHVDQHGGVAAGMSAEALSQGQKQLFNVARAILRRRSNTKSGDEKSSRYGGGGVLLLDEISASLDKGTEETIHRVIDGEFKGYTMLMITHRLEPILNFDAVFVMDKGCLVERGAPRELLQTEGSRFRDLWAAAGGN